VAVLVGFEPSSAVRCERDTLLLYLLSECLTRTM
jgi:hypothetical protein